jgi:A/G-specific adenine glycosylase
VPRSDITCFDIPPFNPIDVITVEISQYTAFLLLLFFGGEPKIQIYFCTNLWAVIVIRLMSIDFNTMSAQTKGAILQALHQWYAAHQRDLPWRHIRDPYAIWISEVMLQQTQVKTMQSYYERFMEQYPTVGRLAEADIQTVLKSWEGLGYYSRARNLHRTAKIVATQMKGSFPRDWETMKSLPGIGDYIAAAVLSIAFNGPYAVVDGNVKRVLARLFMVDRPVNHSSGHKVFHTAAQRLLPRKATGDHNQAMMELGALVCTPRHPGCDQCPIRRYCLAATKNLTDRYPRRLKRASTPQHRMVAGVVVKNGRMLLTQRQPEGLLGGLWEFPNARLAADDDPARACTSMVHWATGLDVAVMDHLTSIRHAYTHFKIHMHVYSCRWQSGCVRLDGAHAFRWVHPDNLTDFPMHGAVQKILSHLEMFFGRP